MRRQPISNNRSFRRRPLGLVAIAAMASASAGFTAAPATAVGPATTCEPAVYMTSWWKNLIDRFDPSTRSLDSNFAVSSPSPRGIGVSPEGSEIYVGTVDTGFTPTRNRLSIINTVTKEEVRSIDLGLFTPFGVAVAPNGKVYVALNGEGIAAVKVVDPANNYAAKNVTDTDGEIIAPYNLAVSPNGATVYVADQGGRISAIDTATDTVRANPIRLADINATKVAVSPDGKTLYVVNASARGTGGLLIIDADSGDVREVIDVGSAPEGVAVAPDGATVYVASKNTDTVSVVSLSASPKVARPINIGDGPGGANNLPLNVEVSPDGKLLYVASLYSPAFSVFDLTDNDKLVASWGEYSWGGIAMACAGGAAPPSPPPPPPPPATPPTDYTTTGFFSPTRMGGATNPVKAGATMPLKFRVAQDGVVVDSLEVVTSLDVDTTSCSEPTATRRAIGVTVDALPSLRFDAASQHFTLNWKTPKARNICYMVTATIDDGDTLVAHFHAR
jgi:DNA-binding beta-propeller fold protein YncE